ncbi:MAG TPA: OB-fold nucleic acid binding domain-containing protein, partial [Casimicrobiaceae bacterium]|nr:OB-fold nucleic acid binding domain-containing protein [Casimicrobiaceae bacterium]
MTESRQTRAPVGLSTPLQFVKGVGPHRAAQLEKKGLTTVEDALFYLPLRHEDRTRFTPLRSIRPGDVVTCSGIVTGVSAPPPGRRRTPLVLLLRDESGYGAATVFGRPWVARAVQRGQRLIVHGRVTRYHDKISVQVAEWETVDAADDAP